MSKIVVFVGLLGSGKTFQSQQYFDKGYVKVSFAQALRNKSFDLLGYKPSDYDKFKKCLVYLDTLPLFASNILKRIFPQWRTGREFLQYASDVFKQEDKDIWTKITLKDIESNIKDGKNIVIDDCRFKHEIKAIQQCSAKNNAELKIYFADYKSDRYNNNDKHNSELFAFWLRDELRLKDLQEITVDNGFYYIKDGKRYKTAVEIYRNDQLEERDLLKDKNLNIFEQIMLNYKGE